MEGRERLKTEADHFRWVDGSFNKQGNLHTRLILGGWKMSRSTHLPARILKVYTKDLTGFSHIYHPEGLNSTPLSQSCVLENGSHCGNGGQSVHSKDRGGGEGPPIAGSSPRGQVVVTSAWWPLPSIAEVVSDHRNSACVFLHSLIFILGEDMWLLVGANPRKMSRVWLPDQGSEEPVFLILLFLLLPQLPWIPDCCLRRIALWIWLTNDCDISR